MPIILVLGQTKTTIALQKKKPGQIFITAFVGVVLGIGLLTLGQERVTSSVAGVLGSTIPLFVVLLGLLTFFRKRKTDHLSWAGVLLGLIGVILIYAPWSQEGSSGVGVALVLFGSFFVAVEAQFILKWFSSENIFSATALTVFWAGVVFAVIAFVEGDFQTGSWLPVILLAIFSNSVAHLLYFFLIKKSGPEFANIYAYIIPVIAILAGFFLNSEPLTVLILIGAALCLLGSVFVGQGQRE